MVIFDTIPDIAAFTGRPLCTPRATMAVDCVVIDETGPSIAFSFTANGTVAAWLRASRREHP